MRRVMAFAAVCLVIMLTFAVMYPPDGFANSSETPAPTTCPVPEGVAPNGMWALRYAAEYADDLLNFKDILFRNGFYISSVGGNSGCLLSKELDDLTMAAVKRVCDLNDLPYYKEGITYDVFWRVTGITGPLITPEIADSADNNFTTIVYGTEDVSVQRVQNRLSELGYNANYVPGVYDAVLQLSIDMFTEYENFHYDRALGITPELQEYLFSDKPTAYVTPEPTDAPEIKKSFSRRVLDYFADTSTVFGIEISNIVIWAADFLLLCAIVLLVLKLVSPGDSAKKSGRAHKDGGRIEFDIEYGAESYTYFSDIDQYVRIGRQTGNFPLRLADKTVSRKHCEIYRVNGKLMLRDYSRYGTLINGETCLSSEHMLKSGDVITVGAHRITVRF